MGLLQIILIVFHDLVSTHAALAGQNLALRQQLAVPRQSAKRLKLRRRDRLFCVARSRFWKGLAAEPARRPASHRGHLMRWLIQPRCGVYVGHPLARIRDRIWDLVCEEIDMKGGAAILIDPDANEQGCRILTCGKTPKVMVGFEGPTPPKTPKSRR